MQCIKIEAFDLFPEESATLSITRILKEADAISLRCPQTSERILCHPPSELTGLGIAPFPPAVRLNAFQEPKRNRLDNYVDDT
jgi:hypothetical protein